MTVEMKCRNDGVDRGCCRSLQAGAERARSDHEATRHRDGQRYDPSSAAAVKKLVDGLF